MGGSSRSRSGDGGDGSSVSSNARGVRGGLDSGAFRAGWGMTHIAQRLLPGAALVLVRRRDGDRGLQLGQGLEVVRGWVSSIVCLSAHWRGAGFVAVLDAVGALRVVVGRSVGRSAAGGWLTGGVGNCNADAQIDQPLLRPPPPRQPPS